MHDVRVPLNGVQLFDFDCAEFADLAQVVAPEIDQHVMFRQLLFVSKKLLFQQLVFLVRFPARTRSRQGERVQNAVLQLDQRFRGRPGNFNVSARQIKHVRRRVNRSQVTVRVEQTAFKIHAQAVGQNNLENIAFVNVLLRFANHVTISLFVKQSCYRTGNAAFGNLPFFARLEKIDKLVEFFFRLSVSRLDVVQGHVDNQNELLTEVVERDNFVKEHQVDVVELLDVFDIPFRRRLGIEHVIVGEIADHSPGKRRQAFYLWASISRQNFANLRFRIGRCNSPLLAGAKTGLARLERAFDLHLSMGTGDYQFRIKPQKRIPSPFLVCRRRLQQIAVIGNVFENPQSLNGRTKVGQNFAVNRDDVVLTGLRVLFDGF